MDQGTANEVLNTVQLLLQLVIFVYLHHTHQDVHDAWVSRPPNA